MIIFVSQLLERLDRFLVEGVNFLHVLGYLASSMPFRWLQVLPVATFMATLFVVGNLSRTREYIAGLASGVAPEKFLGGLFLAGFIISLLALTLNETIIPPLTRYSRAIYREKIRHLGQWRQTTFSNLYVAGAEGRLWNAKEFLLDEGHMKRVIIDTFTAGRLKNQIDALSAQWTEEGWVFKKGVVRNFTSGGLTILDVKKFDELTLPFKENPEDLMTQEPQPEQMNFKGLQKHIKRLSSLGVPVRKLKVELMMKLSFPFSCFVVTLLGIPLALKGKGSWGLGIATALLLTLTYMGFMELGKALAQRLIPPLLGAWMANIVFLSLGLYLWFKMRRTA